MSMIIKQQITAAFVQQVVARKKYDIITSRFTEEPDVGKDGLNRYTLVLAVPGERDQLRVTVSQGLLGREPEALVGQVVSLTYIAKVEVKWASAEVIQTLGGESA